MILFIRNDLRLAVQFEESAAQMVGILIARISGHDNRCVGMQLIRHLGLHQRNTLLVIHHMQTATFKIGIDRVDGVRTIYFETGQIQPHLSYLSGIAVERNLSGPDTAAIIVIISRSGYAACRDRRGRRRKLIPEIPKHRGKMRHERDITMIVMRIVDRRRANGRS